MDCSTPGSSVLHYLLEFTQIHVHWVGDTIQPSHALLSPSPLTFSLSQHQGLFHWVSSLHQVAKGLEFQLQHQSFSEYSGSISFRIDCSDLLAIQVTRSSIFLEKPGLCILMDCFLILTRWLTHYKIYCEDQTKHIHKLHGDSLLILFFPDTIT